MPKNALEGALALALARLAADLAEPGATSDIPVRDAEITTPFSTMSQSDWATAVELWNTNGRRLTEMLPRRDCPACGERERARHIFDSYDGHPYFECEKCGCWYVPYRVDAQLFEDFFGLCPEAREVARRAFDTRLSERSREADFVRFAGYFDVMAPLLGRSQSLRYLDIGCGVGNSLRVAARYGMTAHGLESSSECIRLAAQAGLDVRRDAESLRGEPFGLVTFWESLEHIDDPLGALEYCRSVLAEDGLIAFSVPNLNSSLLQLQRADCSIVHGGYDTPGHINLFRPGHVEALFARAGYEVIYLDGQYSSNLQELVSYALGKTRGAASLLDGKPVESNLGARATFLLESIASAAYLIERMTLTTPILFGVACRASGTAKFSTAVAAMQDARRRDVMAQAAAAFPIVDLATDENVAPSAEFQNSLLTRQQDEIQRLRKDLADRSAAVENTLREVTRRDQLLNATQAEVNRRDALLAEKNAEVVAVRREVLRCADEVTTVRAEVERRDALVAERDALLAEKNAEVAAAHHEIMNRVEKARIVRAEVERKDALLAERDALLAEKDLETGAARQEMMKRDQAARAEIAAKDTALVEMRHELATLRAEISAGNASLKEAMAEIDSRDAMLEALNDRVPRLTAEAADARDHWRSADTANEDLKARLDYFERHTLLGLLIRIKRRVRRRSLKPSND